MATQRLDKIMGEVPGVPPGDQMISIVKRIDRGLEVGSPPLLSFALWRLVLSGFGSSCFLCLLLAKL